MLQALCSPAGSKQQAGCNSRGRAPTVCRRTSRLKATCYRGDAYQPSTVKRIQPGTDLHATEQAVKTLGQAYIMHRLQRQLHTRLGKEQEVFAGLSRMMLDNFSHDPVLYISNCIKAAAVVLTNQQQAALLEDLHSMDFSIIPGTLQMLVAIPEDSLPLVKAEAEQSYTAGLAAIRHSGYTGVYQQIMLIGVQPEVQNQGLGSALMKSIVYNTDEQQQPLLVEVPNESGVGFFRKFGFEIVGMREWRPLMLQRVQAS